MNTTKTLAVANIEEFTQDYIWDRKRDSFIVNVSEEYKNELYRILMEMGYDLILSHYHKETDCVTLVFLR